MEPPVEEIVDGPVTWRFDRDFLTSRWTCIWGRGCLGILDEPAEELGQGCCSVGAILDGEDEARLISALAATIDPDRFQHHLAAAEGGVFADPTGSASPESPDSLDSPGSPDSPGAGTIATRVVDGACIFLNRPGFAGGAGCALHLEAIASDESALDWKPSVCWQLPIRVDWTPGNKAGSEVATVRRWSRADWGDEGESMAWCCTEGDRAYVGDRPVVESLEEELRAVVGAPVYIELRRRLDQA